MDTNAVICFSGGKNERNPIAAQLIAMLSGVFFAAYSAYNIFVIIRDARRDLSAEGIVISAVVALAFAVFAVFSWTAETKTKYTQVTAGFISTDGVSPGYVRFLMIRRAAFIIALITIFLLKLRMVGKVADYHEPSKLHTVLYACTYFMTLAALLLLLIYFTFIRIRLPFLSKRFILFPASILLLSLCSLILEIILFFGYNICLEANILRTAVIRPVFYMGFILLCVYFMFPVQAPEEDNVVVDDTMYVF